MKDIKSFFLLDPDIAFLNFGSFGACPKPVFEVYQQWQRKLEYEPVQFIAVEGPNYLRTAREALGHYLHADAEDLVYVTNPSYALNMVAASFPLKEGDEVLSTDLEYGASDKAWMYYCKRAGARYVRQPIHLPLQSEEQFVKEFMSGVSEHTRLIFISHITSSTGLIFPVEKIIRLAKEQGIPVFVDGAHVPAHLDLNLRELSADFYTGACHKWMMAPKGSSFLYASKKMQALVDPLVVSWGYNNPVIQETRFLDYHQMQGTRDFSAFLTVPSAIDFMKENGWKEVSAACRKMVLEQAPRFFSLLGTDALAPLHDNFIGQMLSLPIRCDEPETLQRELFTRFKIEIPVMRHGDHRYIRYSINGFNTEQDLDRLYQALRQIKEEGKYLH